MERSSSRRASTVRIETEAEQPSLDPQGLEVKALRDRHLLREDEEIDHRVFLVSTDQENTRAAASRLRRLAAEELELFDLEEEKRYDIELILSELITNTFRYSEGPLWVSIVKSTIHVNSKAICVITVTVANELGEGASKEVEYEGAVEPDEDGMPGISVHGRGMTIIEGTAAERGKFEINDYPITRDQRTRLLGTYAVIGCTDDDDTGFRNLIAAA